MPFEHQLKVLIVDLDLQKNIDAMTADGWKLLPDVKPVAIFHLVKETAAVAPLAGVGGVAELKIDESKIVILRKDGTIG